MFERLLNHSRRRLLVAALPLFCFSGVLALLIQATVPSEATTNSDIFPSFIEFGGTTYDSVAGSTNTIMMELEQFSIKE